MLQKSRVRNWQPAIALLALVIAIALSAGNAFAGKLSDTTYGLSAQTATSPVPQLADLVNRLRQLHGDAPVTPGSPGSAPQAADAYMNFVPEAAGPGYQAAPARGGTVNVGDRFILDLMVVGPAHPDLTAQQTYL